MISLVPSTWFELQNPLPPVGSVDAMTSPAWSAATQNEAVGHETASMTTPGTTLTFDHVPVPPVGLAETRTFPSPSPATHKEVVGHATPASHVPGSTNHLFQVEAPPVGSVDVKTFPPGSTATQRPVDGHDTACKWVIAPNGGDPSIGPVLDHVSAGGGSATAPNGAIRSPAKPTRVPTKKAIPLRITPRSLSSQR